MQERNDMEREKYFPDASFSNKFKRESVKMPFHTWWPSVDTTIYLPLTWPREPSQQRMHLLKNLSFMGESTPAAIWTSYSLPLTAVYIHTTLCSRFWRSFSVKYKPTTTGNTIEPPIKRSSQMAFSNCTSYFFRTCVQRWVHNEDGCRRLRSGIIGVYREGALCHDVITDDTLRWSTVWTREGYMPVLTVTNCQDDSSLELRKGWSRL